MRSTEDCAVAPAGETLSPYLLVGGPPRLLGALSPRPNMGGVLFWGLGQRKAAGLPAQTPVYLGDVGAGCGKWRTRHRRGRKVERATWSAQKQRPLTCARPLRPRVPCLTAPRRTEVL
jgi:hypothetical protein